MSRIDPTLMMWFAHVLEKKTEKFIFEFKSLDLYVDKDSIRRIRVASRRLRTVFLVSGGGQFLAEQKKLRVFLKKIGRMLSELRDIDVQIESIEAIPDNLFRKADHPGISRLLLRLRQRRDSVCANTENAINKMRSNSIFQTFYEELQRMRIRTEMTDSKIDFSFLRSVAFETINMQIIKLLSYSRSLNNPIASEEHHEMRAETKRLRYALEIFNEVYEGSLNTFISRLKELQTLLGELHDADVWLSFLSQFMEEELKRTETFYGTPRNFSRIKPGILALTRVNEIIRAEMYQKSTFCWDEMKKECFFDELKRNIGEWSKRDREINLSDINQKNLPVSADGIE